MRFFLILWLVMYELHAASQITELSFSVFLEINGQFIYPAGQSAGSFESKPFEMIVSVRGLTHQNLRRILLDFCSGNLKIASIKTIQASIDPLLKDGIVMTRVESEMTSSMASPVEAGKSVVFPILYDLLTLSKNDLIEHVYGNILRVSIETSTDSIYTVGHRLRQRELDLFK
jgi:hypothetical protein